MTPLKAIREKCVDCCCGQTKEVKLCPDARCALHPYRMGTDTLKPKRAMTEEQREKLRESARRNFAKKPGAVTVPPTEQGQEIIGQRPSIFSNQGILEGRQ